MINLDFADVKTIMSGMGVAMMGTATAEGPSRALEAAQRAISSPLLEDASVNGARGVIINVTGGPDMSLMEVNEALTVIQEAAHEDANIIFGAVVDPTLTGKVKITVIATGFDHVSGMRSSPARGADADAGGPAQLHDASGRRPARRRRAAAAADWACRAPALDDRPPAWHRAASPASSNGPAARPASSRRRGTRPQSASSRCRRSCAAARAERAGSRPVRPGAPGARW